MSGSSIKIWFGSLAAYNDGRLSGEWVELPQPKETLQKLYNRYTDQGRHDYFIADYEAPFKIGEYADIFRISDFAEAYEALSDNDRIKLDYLVDNGSTMEEALDELDDIEVLPYNSFKELAESLVDDGCFGPIPESLSSYIDYEAIGRDLSFEGVYTVCDGYMIEDRR